MPSGHRGQNRSELKTVSNLSPGASILPAIPRQGCSVLDVPCQEQIIRCETDTVAPLVVHPNHSVTRPSPDACGSSPDGPIGARNRCGVLAEDNSDTLPIPPHNIARIPLSTGYEMKIHFMGYAAGGRNFHCGTHRGEISYGTIHALAAELQHSRMRPSPQPRRPRLTTACLGSSGVELIWDW